MTGRLWLTYAWADNDEGDFDYLVQELEDAGIHATYDKIALIPGRRLWGQIAEQMMSPELDAWAYLVTPNSLTSSACEEELSYALQRALEVRGEEFPLVGMLHQVSIRDVPLSLRVRLCVNLANPDWIEEIRAAVVGVPPRRVLPSQDPFVTKLHDVYLGDLSRKAIEVRPRFGEERYWRFAFPSDGPQPVGWGVGPANGGGLAAVRTETVEGEYENLDGVAMKFIGVGNPITPATSAYVVFDGELPKKFFFGLAKEPFGTDAAGRIFVVEELRGAV
jgi:hypothetical protein